MAGGSLWVSWVHMDVVVNQSWFLVYKIEECPPPPPLHPYPHLSSALYLSLIFLPEGPRIGKLVFPTLVKRKECSGQGFPTV